MRARTFLRLIWILISVASGWGATPSLSLARQPLSFEPNLGQTSPEAKYLARGNGYELFLTQHEAVLRLRQKNFSDSILRVRWIFANPAAAMHQEEELEGRVNYLRGNDPTNWLTNVHTFRKVRLAKVYKGIDLVFYGNQREL